MPKAHAKSILGNRYFSAAILATAIVFALSCWLLLSAVQLEAFFSEMGPIERASPPLYFVGGIGMWLFRRRGDNLCIWLALSCVIVAFGAREMDLHKSLTGFSVLKLSYYFHSVPWWHKALAACAVLPVLGSMGYLLVVAVRSMPRALRRGDSSAMTVLVFVSTLVISKVLDRSVNVLSEDFGLSVSEALRTCALALEETLELSLPVLFMVGLLQWREERRRAEISPSQP